ncbi:MAG: hypothetical protein LBJ67_02550 [Planctomycetaceae bacterium]|jgi:L-seryl-tRNA(Ser) seleniumtransferase|nr:hypothetical protein [Planctomycetaceae bacterium]
MSNYSIPSINDILSSPKLKQLANRFNPIAVFNTAKSVLDEVATEAKNAASERRFPDVSELSERIASRLKYSPFSKTIPPEINATGVLFLDPAPCQLPVQAIDRLIKSFGGEYDKMSPNKPSGDSENSNPPKRKTAEEMICELTGAEDTAIVGNHAAALILTASAYFSDGGDVCSSHTDLYETLTGYRVQEIFERAGVLLVNPVGTAAHVTPDDYLQMIREESMFLYASNGADAFFYEPRNRPEISQLADIAEKHKLPLVFDAEWGAFHSVKEYGLDNIPTYRDLIQQGVSLLIFSCGGLNACDFATVATENAENPIANQFRRHSLAVIAGGKKWVNRIRKSPLFSAFIPAAHEVAALEAILQLFESRNTAENTIPLWQLLSTEQDNLRLRADRMSAQLAAVSGVADAVAVSCHACLTPLRPGYVIPSWQVLITLESQTAPEILLALANYSPGIATSLVPEHLNQIAINLRTVFAKYDMLVIEALTACLTRAA